MIGANDLFRERIVPHFEAAYNLAYWLTGNEADAADCLQDASLRAFRFMDSLKTEESRAWFLQITRNSCYTLLRSRKISVDLDEAAEVADPGPSSDAVLIAKATAQSLQNALNELSVPHREILVLRELDECSYEDIAAILQIPQGTVMSRLARAREALSKKLRLKGDFP